MARPSPPPPVAAGRKFVIQTEVPFVGDASFDLDLTPGNFVLAPLPTTPKKLGGAVTVRWLR